jgi:hypothetical protein
VQRADDDPRQREQQDGDAGACASPASGTTTAAETSRSVQWPMIRRSTTNDLQR